MCIYSGWIIPFIDFNIVSWLALVGTITAGTNFLSFFSHLIFTGGKR